MKAFHFGNLAKRVGLYLPLVDIYHKQIHESDIAFALKHLVSLAQKVLVHAFWVQGSDPSNNESTDGITLHIHKGS